MADGEGGGEAGLEIFGRKPGVLRDPRQHLRPDFFAVMEGEHEIGPVVAAQSSVRTGLPIDRPA